ncbi:MAG: Sulfotransferase family protein [Candidatus Eremiobacteraeota bacterium]|nr:Sulfotransferase family protein [Candidatus Eremiobacteraeota bacterium]
MSELDDPVVLLGRGGSGTRLLAQLGAANGVFIGNDVNASGDSLEWVDDLYALAIECVTSGVEADSERDAFWRAALVGRARAVLEAAGRDAGAPWGWKLPETMLGLPQVLRAFPRARIVHLIRHPVSSSLRRSHMTSRADNAVGRAVLAAAYDACGLDPNVAADDPDDVRNAMTWEFQMRGALDALAALPDGARLLQLRYEVVCADPAAALDRIAAFLGLPAPDRASAPVIDERRSQPIAGDGERAARVWALCGATGARLGYRPPPG